MDIENIWNRILEYEGAIFYTVTRLPFSYRINRNQIIPIRNGLEINRAIPRTDIERTIALWSLAGPGAIAREIQGSSYVYGILIDNRINR